MLLICSNHFITATAQQQTAAGGGDDGAVVCGIDFKLIWTVTGKMCQSWAALWSCLPAPSCGASPEELQTNLREDYAKIYIHGEASLTLVLIVS